MFNISCFPLIADKMASWPNLICIQKCSSTWGYLFVPSRDGTPLTSLDFFACGQLHAITYGQVSDSEKGKPKAQPDGSWRFDCDCVTNEDFLQYLKDINIRHDWFTWFKTNDPQNAMPWLQAEIKEKKLEVGLMTQNRFIEWIKRLLSKYKVKTKEQLYREYRENPDAPGVAGEKYSDADSDYWEDNLTWIPEESLYAEDYKMAEGEIR